MPLKAHFGEGRILANEPTHPEGAEVEHLDPGDGLDAEGREALHRALIASQEDVDAGRLLDAEEVLRANPLKPRMTWEELKAMTREP